MNPFHSDNVSFTSQYGHAPASRENMRPVGESYPVASTSGSSLAGTSDSGNSAIGGSRVSGTLGTTEGMVVAQSSSITAHDGSNGKLSENTKLAAELNRFNKVAEKIRSGFAPKVSFEQRCQQAFDVANDLFVNAPTWVCFYRELMGGRGLIIELFPDNDQFGSFLRTDQYHQIQMMLTALRSRDLPENDPHDPQRMITVRLPKSLHEAMCDEAGRLNISVNRLCISRMLQLLDPKMIPETQSKPRGRKPRART